MQRFKLSEKFLEEYKTRKPDWGPLGEFVFYRTYSRQLEGRNEQWWETVRRVVEGTFSIQKQHCGKLRLPWNNTKGQCSAQIMYEKIFSFKFLPPGRGLWMAGTDYVYERGGMALNNCLGKSSEVLTSDGYRYIGDIDDGSVVDLWSPTEERWVKGTKESYGVQNLNKVVLKSWKTSNHKIEIFATANHQWILVNGDRVTSLTVGDRIKASLYTVGISKEFDKGLVHGIVFGDGTKSHTHQGYDRNFRIELYGDKVQWKEFLEKSELFFSSYSKKSREGWVVNFRSVIDLKALPINMSMDYMAGFVTGYLDMDSYCVTSQIKLFTTRDVEAYEFVKTYAYYAGWHVVGNTAPRVDNTSFSSRQLYTLRLRRGGFDWKVVQIEKNVKQEIVHCFEVTETHDFTIANGVASGNCAFVSTEDIKYRGVSSFMFMMDALMNGVGVGFDTKGAGTITIRTPKTRGGLITIEDSREGWVEATGEILTAFFAGEKLPELDYSLIRQLGMPIRGFGGVASGAKPLKQLHGDLTVYLENHIGKRLSSVMIVDIMNMIGKCVVAGNVRRSAEIAIGDARDTAYRTMKDPETHSDELMSWRWASNNSVFARVGMDYKEVVDSIVKNGEPGLIWLHNMQNQARLIDNGNGKKDLLVRGTNPCGEMSLESMELCNLVETFPSRHESYVEYQETLKYAYLYAKTVTLIPTHWPETNQVMLKNRRIGTSQSGIIDAFVRHGRRMILQWSDAGYSYLKELDQIYSDWLCVPRSIKITTIKPSGTVSLLPGVSPGIHYPHAEFYIRRVRIAASSPLVSIVEKAGYPIEDDQYQSGTKVVSFPIQERLFSRKKEDVSVWEQVVNAVDYQTYWSDNNVSITVTFKENEVKDVVSVLEAFEDKLKAISFLPLKDHGYVQAPYEEITEEIYQQMVKPLKPMDFSGLSIEPEGSRYCDSDSCEIGVKQ